MKNTTRRLLLAGTTLVLAATVSACSFHGRTAESRADWLAERVTDKLELDSEQQAHLANLKQVLVASREQAIAERARASDEIRELLAGETIDRERARQVVSSHTMLFDTQAEPVIAAFADFYDSLNPDQQAQLRDKVQRFEHRHGRHRPFH